MSLKICIVVANYYTEISKKLLNGARKTLAESNIDDSKIIFVNGVFEIPVAIAKRIDKFDAFVALACVIKGKTPHFDFICNSVTNGIMNLSITHKKVIGNGIITCLNKKQALERSAINKKNKGGEAAKAVLAVHGLIDE